MYAFSYPTMFLRKDVHFFKTNIKIPFNNPAFNITRICERSVA